jgi:hypothetical protein
MCILKTLQRGKRDVRKKYGCLRKRNERERERVRKFQRERETNLFSDFSQTRKL